MWIVGPGDFLVVAWGVMVKFLLGAAAPDIEAGLWRSPMLLALPLARRSGEVRRPFLKTYKLALFASIHEALANTLFGGALTSLEVLLAARGDEEKQDLSTKQEAIWGLKQMQSFQELVGCCSPLAMHSGNTKISCGKKMIYYSDVKEKRSPYLFTSRFAFVDWGLYLKPSSSFGLKQLETCSWCCNPCSI